MELYDIWFGDAKVPWNNSMECSTELHAIPWISVMFWVWYLIVPWNSMELGDIVFGDTRVPWNSMEYSIEFHGISCHSTFHGTFLVSWNSMELPNWAWGFHMNSMEFGYGAKFHGIFKIPWNSMELLNWVWRFHGTSLNSMELCYGAKFHVTFKIPWNFWSMSGDSIWNSMEFGVGVKFHGTFRFPWYFMELTLWHRKVPWNSMELWNTDINKFHNSGVYFTACCMISCYYISDNPLVAEILIYHSFNAIFGAHHFA